MASETVQTFFVRIEVKSVVTNTANDGEVQTVNYVKEYTWTDGTGTDQVGQVLYDASRTLAATNEDLDVVGSTLKAFGGNADMTGLKFLLIENTDTDTGDYLEVKQPASNGIPGIFLAAGDGMKVHPGGLMLWIAPGPDVATVTASTGDLINVAAADTSIYKLILAGKNA